MKPRLLIILLIVPLVTVVCAAWFAPYVDGELARWLQPHTIVEPAAVKIAKGEMVDDYFAVEDLERVRLRLASRATTSKIIHI